MEEIWKDIKGYEGLYQVSNLGNVKSLCYNKTKNLSKLLKPRNNKVSGDAYFIVSLCKNGIHKNFYIHRLVAEAFIANVNDLPQVNHIDEDKSNNKVSNLEWCTIEYNLNYGTRREKEARTKGISVFQYTKDGNFVKEYYSIREATRQTGITNVGDCIRGKSKTAGGFIWKLNKIIN